MVNFKELDRLTEEGYLRKVISDCGRLVLYNYTDHCTYNRHWNEHTLNARGTVYEIETGKIVARAFPKFFNFEELAVSKQRNILKQKNFHVFDKADGSLGIVYFYDGEWHVNTRGSFSSEQAIEAKKILEEKYDTQNMRTNYTYLVEIIYPENKIILDYGNMRDLVLLSIIDNNSGKELSYRGSQFEASITNMPIVNVKSFNSIQDVIDEQLSLDKNTEGFVVLLENGERVKFKSKEYLKIASAMSHMTPLHFWKNMKKGQVPLEFLESFPEEIREEAESIADSLCKKYDELQLTILNDFINIKKDLCPVIVNNKKEFCKYVGMNIKDMSHPNAFFSLINQNTEKFDEYIYKNIRPKGNEL